jgi:hypothetical protein
LFGLQKGVFVVERRVIEEFARGDPQGFGDGLDDVVVGFLRPFSISPR